MAPNIPPPESNFMEQVWAWIAGLGGLFVWLASLVAFARRDQNQENRIEHLETSLTNMAGAHKVALTEMDNAHKEEIQKLVTANKELAATNQAAIEKMSQFFMDGSGNLNIVTMPTFDRMQAACQSNNQLKFDSLRKDTDLQYTALNARVETLENQIIRNQQATEKKLDRVLMLIYRFKPHAGDVCQIPEAFPPKNSEDM